jgi:excisionase family DNA binding protein
VRLDNVDVSMHVSETPLADRRGLRIKEAADYIGSSPWFVEVAIRTKKIPAFKLGRHYVLFREDLDAYVNGVRSGAAL